MMLMPSGITAIDTPWNVRPTIIGTSVSLSAPITDPAISSTRLSSSIRRLPYMSPSRPTTGLATAPASRVAVIAQVASDGEEFSSLGSSGTIGMISVCISETVIPPSARTQTTAPERERPTPSTGTGGEGSWTRTW